MKGYFTNSMVGLAILISIAVDAAGQNQAGPVPDHDALATGPDGNPGLTIAASGGKVTESDPFKYQQWFLVPGSPLELNGPVTLDLWSTTAGYVLGKPVDVAAYLFDCAAGNPADCGPPLLSVDRHTLN